MTHQREATTDHLVAIIATIKMERQSGQLRVRRGEGLTTEEGILTFHQGQITRASVGRRSNAEALNWLSTWGQAHYTFLPTISGEEIDLEIFMPGGTGKAVTHPDLLVARANTDRLNTEDLDLDQPTGPLYETPRACAGLTEAAAHIARAGLSRAHKRLFLLIDGHRSVYELAPLSGKGLEEVRSMLQDLEWLGIIQMAGPPASW